MFFSTKKKKIVTHNGTFHTDDVFACAMVQLLFDQQGEKYEVIRTRAPEIIAAGDIVFDIGGKHDAEALRFDHHQHGGAGKRENGVPYAAAGLVWQHVGPQLCPDQETVEYIDAKLIQAIDAVDNGVNISQTIIDDVYPYTVQSMVNSFRPTWQEEDKTDDGQFLVAVSFMKQVLQREIIKASSRIDARQRIESYVNQSNDKRIVVIDGPEKFSREDILPVLCEYDEPIYFVYQKSAESFWKVEGVRKFADVFELRKPFPESWRGKRDEALQEAMGMKEGIFCHNGGFLTVVTDKESAIKAAHKALEEHV